MAVDGLSEAEVGALVHADHGDPFAVLGMHDDGGQMVVRALRPGVDRVEVVESAKGAVVARLARRHPQGLFAGPLKRRRRFRYRLRVAAGPETWEEEDPYRFGTLLDAGDLRRFAEGRLDDLWRVLGAHPAEIDGVAGTRFAVWAPNARRVAVVGDFNGWDGRRHGMRRRPEAGVWEIFLPGVGPGALYKYEIRAADGSVLPLKSDPMAFATERPPSTASIVAGLGELPWSDRAWLDRRGACQGREAPIAIYECHLGSWMRVPEEGNRYLSYDELGERLIPYAADMGFTHLELLPVSEHPFDGSWGYQPIGLYAPTSRHGPPEAFARFVDRCHEAGLGVLLDWVPGHFPTDAHGLGSFDGTHLYEHADPRQGFHLDWNTLIYNFGRSEVAGYLLANARFWLERYHVDGLRVDAVASMLYLDYSRPEGGWIPNRFGGRENLEAIDFLKRLNEQAYAAMPGIMTVAEESTAWPQVSRPTWLGGLGFGFKWNMGWMHDTLRYIGKDPVHRKYHHNDLSFGLLYAFSENFVLPLSHDEVVHGKGSLLARMPGDRWRRFANLRAYLSFMYGHPGKKLLFMGGELAQEREWSHERSLDWHLLDDPAHRGVQRLVRDLNHLYRATPALHARDCEPEGFAWIEAADVENSVLAFERRAPDAPAAVVVCNFTPMPRHGYRLGLPAGGRWREALNSDSEAYGGSNAGNGGSVQAEATAWHGRDWSTALTLPPLAALILVHEPT